MSFIGQVVNINQTMYVPAQMFAEHLASMKFADEFAKIQAKEKERKIEDVKKVEEVNEIDENPTKNEERQKNSALQHIDIKG